MVDETKSWYFDYMNIQKELEQKKKRHAELEEELQKPAVIADTKKLKALTQEYNELGEVISRAKKLDELFRAMVEATRAAKEEPDTELRAMAEEELTALEQKKSALEAELTDILSPKDPLDGKNIIIEIRAGTGGDEAALFAAELFRMYGRFAERKNWKTRLISQTVNDLGGAKDVTFEIAGRNVYRHLKYESGVHRVQRIPSTEKSGRIHTSTVTVAVLPEAEEVDIQIEPKDIKVETSTARGHGGQSVNTTYSAIRITHLATGIVVSCQDERSQQQNRERAMQVLRARLFAHERERRHSERAAARKSMVGTGERAEKIRTYNFPQDRVTDHRINESWHDINGIMDGNLSEITNALEKVEHDDTV